MSTSSARTTIKTRYPGQETAGDNLERKMKSSKFKSAALSIVDSAIDKENNVGKYCMTNSSSVTKTLKITQSDKASIGKAYNRAETNIMSGLKKERVKINPVPSNRNDGHSSATSDQKKRARPRTSTAASFLGKTADGLASSPKKLHSTDQNNVTKLDGQHVSLSRKLSHGTSNAKTLPATPVKSKKANVTLVRKLDVVKEPKAVNHTVEKKALNANYAVASPCKAKIPNDIVRNIVNNIQGPPATAKKEAERIGHIRKSLAGVFDQRKSAAGKRKSYMPISDEEVAAEDFSVTVAVRVRPFSQREIDLKSKQVVFVDGNETTVTDGSVEHSFIYDHSFWSANHANGEFATQDLVYEKLGRPLLYASFDGYNTCLFAYGQTGSGKSYTIMGLGEDEGIVPRFCEELFSCVLTKEKQHANIQYHVQVSYFEIYNEKIHDLLVSSATSDNNAVKQVLRVREHPEYGPYIEGLSKFSVSSFADIQSWLEVGNRQRATACTGMNDKSSRSHSVFTIGVVQTTKEDLEGEIHESSRRSEINLVDLAGSERSSTAGTSGQRLKEGASINKSLLTLGKVISALSERSSLSMKRRKRLFIPYRDSTLTWILRESLGGNSRTAMIATVSPAACHMEETLSTLRYAKQARTIVNLVKINEDPNAKIIRELKSEIAKLKEKYGQNEINPAEFQASLQEVSSLRQRLCAAEREKVEVQEEWKRKLEQSEKRKVEEVNELKRAGVSFKVDNRLPNLVNLNEDPQLSELLLYMIKHGVTKVGKKGGDCDIQLNGALIADFHCEISNIDEVVTIEAIGDAKTFVNGESISDVVTLHHGDRVIIGGDHFFRLNNPIEVGRAGGRKRNSGGKRKDFEFARHELIERQNERLQAEIEEAQIKVKKEMLGEIEAAKMEAEQQISSQRNEYELAIQNLQAQLVKDQEAKRELTTICEQAGVLQKEFKISRKNRQLDEPPVQVDSNAVEIKAQVLACLEEERQKLAKEVEKVQQRRANIAKLDTDPALPLRLSLLLQEANNIAKSLNKHTVFSRHDTSDDISEVKIRVHNTKLSIWTLWSQEKFEEKVEIMREFYNGDRNESSEDADEQVDLFYDPADEWQEAYTSESLGSPRLPQGNQRDSRRLTRRLSSLVLARASPALQESLSRLTMEKSSPMTKQHSLDSTRHIGFCKRLINNAVEETKADTLMDKLLLSLHNISTVGMRITQAFEVNDAYSTSATYMEDSMIITMATEMMLAVVGFIKNSSSEFADSSPSILRLLHQTDKAAKKLAGHTAKLLHGCHSDIERMVIESSSKISQLIPNMSKYGGALSIATNLRATLFAAPRQEQLSHRMKHAFLQGGDTFMRKILSGGIEKMENLEENHSTGDSTKFIGGLKETVTKLLKTCLDLQHELYDTSLLIYERDVPAHYYNEYLQRTQSLIQEVSNLVEGVGHLNDLTADMGKNPESSEEIRLKAELLWRPTSRITDLCMKHEGLCAIMHDISKSKRISAASSCSNNNNSNNNNHSAEAIFSERLCDAVSSSGRSVQEQLREIIDLADTSTASDSTNDSSLLQTSIHDDTDDVRITKRKRRLLPSSPLLLNTVESKHTTSFTVKHAVVRWLQLADSPTNTGRRENDFSNQSVYV